MHRRGVSLMEVMFAIGVVAVGLAGVIAIIPLGLNLVGKGNVADRAMRTGLNAVEHFEARGMNRPERWMYDHPGIFSPVMNATAFTTPPHVPSGYAFCIDPRFVSINSMDISSAAAYPTTNPTYFYDSRFFPYYAPTTSSATTPPGLAPWPPVRRTTEPRMLRITMLRNVPNQPLALMAPLQADLLFVERDDLVFNISDDVTLTPDQDFGLGGVRQFEGLFSWFATLVPISDVSGSLRNQYRLSVVVLHRRDLSMQMYQDLNTNNQWDAGEPPTGNERLVRVASFGSAGYAGGDVILESDAVEDLELKTGEWIMLAGSRGVPSIESPDFRWYRVAATETEPEQIAPNQWQRQATLIGSDWQRLEWHTSVPGSFRPTQATLMTGVVSVYEKTIRLETSSLWIHGG
jgi:hypothetical protein